MFYLVVGHQGAGEVDRQDLQEEEGRHKKGSLLPREVVHNQDTLGSQAEGVHPGEEEDRLGRPSEGLGGCILPAGAGIPGNRGEEDHDGVGHRTPAGEGSSAASFAEGAAGRYLEGRHILLVAAQRVER